MRKGQFRMKIELDGVTLARSETQRFDDLEKLFSSVKKKIR